MKGQCQQEELSTVPALELCGGRVVGAKDPRHWFASWIEIYEYVVYAFYRVNTGLRSASLFFTRWSGSKKQASVLSFHFLKRNYLASLRSEHGMTFGKVSTSASVALLSPVHLAISNCCEYSPLVSSGSAMGGTAQLLH